MWNNPTNSRYGLFVVSSPSGGGKTTVIKEILSRRPEIRCSVSATTRKPGASERDGVSYYFLSHQQFKEMIETERFIEYEEVYGEFYGTPRAPVEEAIASGGIMLFIMDIKGALRMKSVFPEAVLIFLLLPSLEVLRDRLYQRGRDSAENIELRLQRARDEILFAQFYDYRIINENLERTVQEVLRIIDRVLAGENFKINKNPN